MADQNAQGLLGMADQKNMDAAQREQLEEYILKGYHIIYDKNKGALDMATKSTKNKIEGVAEAGYMVARRIDMSQTSKDKPPYPDEIKAIGGAHLIEKLIQYAEHAGTVPFNAAEKQKTLEKAYKKYIDYGIQHRLIDPVQLAQGLEQIQPGITQKIITESEDTSMPGVGGQMPQGQPQQELQGGGMPAGQGAQMPQGGERPQGPPQQMPQGQPQPQQAPQGLLTKPTALQQMEGM